jgi:cell wall-associated NlpC family hydrolase
MIRHRLKIWFPGATARFTLSLLFFCGILLTGCHTGKHLTMEHRSAERNEQIERKIREGVMQWMGTPHRLGGNTKSGVDCSGFVARLYNDLFDIDLPRSTKGQVKTGIPLSPDRLLPGDLVFFKPALLKRHVGIYLGNGEFAHASSTSGVTISNITDRFWRKAYWTARRLL